MTLGWVIAALIGGGLMAIGAVVLCLRSASAWSDARMDARWPGPYESAQGVRWERYVAGICLSALMLVGGSVVVVRSVWTIDREACRRTAARYDTAPRWDRLVGCYLRDDSGRYIPEDAYVTARVEAPHQAP